MSNETKEHTMIDVRIRHSVEPTPRHLMTWPADRLDEVIPLVSGWGLVFSDLGTIHGANAEYSGQFVVTSTDAFFEVLVVEDEDDE